MLLSVVKYATIAFIAATLATSAQSQPEIQRRDLTGDGLEDIVVSDRRLNMHFAFIGKSDGSFDKAEIVIRDGFPFYQTSRGHYDPWGNYFPK